MARPSSPAASALRASRTTCAWSAGRVASADVGTNGSAVGDGLGATVGGVVASGAGREGVVAAGVGASWDVATGATGCGAAGAASCAAPGCVAAGCVATGAAVGAGRAPVGGVGALGWQAPAVRTTTRATEESARRRMNIAVLTGVLVHRRRRGKIDVSSGSRGSSGEVACVDHFCELDGLDVGVLFGQHADAVGELFGIGGHGRGSGDVVVIGCGHGGVVF